MKTDIMNGKELRNPKTGDTAEEPKPDSPGRAARHAPIIACAIVSAFLLIGAIAAPLYAQSYPNKPIRLVLPFAAGGGTDVVGRIIAQKLGERLGQPMVLENRPGAGGNIGIEYVVRAKPDGYTFLLTAPSITTSPSLYKKLTYDPIKDLEPISLVTQMAYLFLVRPSLPVKNLKEFVEYAKANPGKLNYGSAGIGSAGHLAGELFKSLAKINIVHVPYKGGGPALIAVMGSEVDMITLGVPASWAQVQAGKVRIFAVLSKERSPLLPNVPTAIEAGVDDFVVDGWYGLLAPAGTPRDIVNRVSAEWSKIVLMPDTKEQMRKAGFEPLSVTPEQFAEFIRKETARWSQVTREANMVGIID